MATISLNYENVCNEVSRLKRIAAELNTLLADTQNALKDMNSYWEGAAANEFLSVSERWRKDTKAVENEVSELAVLIQKVADEIQEAEMRAAEANSNAGGVSND